MIAPGQRLGGYEIVAQIGEGGMGLVFKAKDFHLGREVALKVLPEAFTADPERIARSEREAKMLASLNHPNIAQIYGFEQGDGTRRALVMELVEGPTLADRLASGALPLDESLSIARQIAEALEEAHERGIIHRDLKPQNIKASIEGKVKVLDFGLAKAMDPTASAPGLPGAGGAGAPLSNSPTLMNSPTLTGIGGTQLGVILGTAAYMSPEQARGRAVDRRADIWAFGVVLWEMLTGRRLFEGETVSDTLAAVLTREPDLGALPTGTPPAVVELVRRCLVRDPRARLQWIGEARLTLASAPDSVAGARGGAGVSGPAGAAEARRRPLARALPWALVVGLGAALSLVLLPALHAPVSATVTAEIRPPRGTAFDIRTRGPGPAAFAPDGSRVAFAAQGRDGVTLLHVRALADGRVTVFPGSEGAQFPFWSPDARWVAFFSRVDGTLKRVPVEGGTPLHICRAANGKGGSWGRDDVLVIAPSSGSVLYRVPAGGGEPVPITRLAAPFNSHRHPRFLPDGRRFLFLARAVRSTESAVFVGSLDGGEPRQVTRSAAQAEFAAGHLLFARESVLMAQPFDPASATLTGEARRVAEDVLELSGAAFSAFSASANGRLAFHAGVPQAPVRIEIRDRQGGALGAVGQPGTYRAPAFSPDGNWLAATGFPGATGTDNHDVWLFDLRGQGALRFTVGPEEEIDATWAPDGRSLFYGSNVEGPHDVLRKSLDGAGAAQIVYQAPGLQTPTGVSRDGRFLLLESGKGEQSRVEALELASGKVWQLREGPFEDARGRLSPDGRWLALVSDESGRPEVYVTPFPGPGRLWPVSTGGGRFPAWREDGREIVYAALDGRFVAVAVAAEGESFRLGAATDLFRGAPPTRDYQDWGMSPDARRFAIVPSGVLEADNELRLILDWPARIADR